MKRSGFTLIEVLVATTIMLLLIVMIGSLFRQATSSWDTGRARGEGGMVTRGVVGAISADLATAIDGRPYREGCLPTASGSTLTFVCYKPTLDGGSKRREVHYKPTLDGGSKRREVHKISYRVGSGQVTREDTVWNGKDFGNRTESVLYKESKDSSDYRYGMEFKVATLDKPDSGLLSPSQFPKESDRTYETKTTWDGIWADPVSVKVRVTLTQEKAFSGLTVRSLGRNGVDDDDEKSKEPDDILIR